MNLPRLRTSQEIILTSGAIIKVEYNAAIYAVHSGIGICNAHGQAPYPVEPFWLYLDTHGIPTDHANHLHVPGVRIKSPVRAPVIFGYRRNIIDPIQLRGAENMIYDAIVHLNTSLPGIILDYSIETDKNGLTVSGTIKFQQLCHDHLILKNIGGSLYGHLFSSGPQGIRETTIGEMVAGLNHVFKNVNLLYAQ